MYPRIFVPSNSEEIIWAAKQFDSRVHCVGLMDSISMVHSCHGVTLYAYQGLAELEKVCEEDKRQARTTSV